MMKPTNEELAELQRKFRIADGELCSYHALELVIERWEEMREERINRDNVPPKEAPT